MFSALVGDKKGVRSKKNLCTNSPSWNVLPSTYTIANSGSPDHLVINWRMHTTRWGDLNCKLQPPDITPWFRTPLSGGSEWSLNWRMHTTRWGDLNWKLQPLWHNPLVQNPPCQGVLNQGVMSGGLELSVQITSSHCMHAPVQQLSSRWTWVIWFPRLSLSTHLV